MIDDPLLWFLGLGFLLQATGFFMRDELALRVLVGLGLLCQAAVAWTLSEPSFDPGLTAPALVLVNLVMIAVVARERSTLGMSKRDQRLFETFRTLTPGQFRRINRLASWSYVDEARRVIEEGQPNTHLRYIDADRFGLEKAGEAHTARGPGFVGEISLLHGGVASASVTLRPGTLFAQWDSAALKNLMARDPALANALTARFSYDLAQRVATSIPMDAAPRD
ncbi:cyclic nucleotide-binding domain-containing protein [Anianabacter salinae]|uniref:hypothetical protein n=1 Tax=Anianabacter salinae TaxID=2851023 RepID=UPI00225DF961|nr:hypothetical protein [Anianabacter salinae]MBV0912753.1 hypothetical protein [Anianabacter salinae]